MIKVLRYLLSVLFLIKMLKLLKKENTQPKINEAFKVTKNC